MLAAVGLAEKIRPKRALTALRRFRWLNNLALVFLNTAVLRVLFATLAVGAAALFQARGVGLPDLQQPRRQNLWWMLALPLERRPN